MNGGEHNKSIMDRARLANHITRVVLGGGDDDDSPMNRAISQLGFLSPGDFMVCTREDLNSLGSTVLSRAQKNRIMMLRQFWASQPVETRRWDAITQEMYEVWLESPIPQMTPPPPPSCQWSLSEEGGPYIFRGTSVQDPTSTEDNARKRKQKRTFSTILLAGDYEEASRQLRDAARPYRGKEPDSPKTYCIPSDRFINSTWNEDEMRRQICERRDKIFSMFKDYVPNDRKQVVIGLRLGTGYGKTHVLTRFPEWLTAHAIYVTYNDNQNLNADQKAPEKALYIRLILALHGWSSKMCSHFMNGDECSPFWNSNVLQLRTLFVHEAMKQANQSPIAIGVDELKDLGNDKAGVVVSELAGTAAQYLKKTVSMCTVVVSSLVSATFKTESGRSVSNWVPRRASMQTLEFFAQSIQEDKREPAMALINAVSGAHMRSIVIAFDLCINGKLGLTVPWMYEQMKDRLGAKETQESLLRVVGYVADCISKSIPPAPTGDVEVLCDEIGAIPPIFLMMAFEAGGKREHLENLLNAFSSFDGGATKQLEAVSKHYDLFRADLGLPVVPGQARVHGTSKGRKPEAWYGRLRFPNDMVLSNDALLQQKDKEINTTDIVPAAGHYYHPEIPNHPCIDRAFVAWNPDDNKDVCFVLAQDKVNASDFSDACRKLNKAAHLLTEKSSTLKNVLLIVNVIGASEGTRAQSELEWPFVLIRGYEEVRKFYTQHFGDMVWFARERHLLSLKSGSSQKE